MPTTKECRERLCGLPSYQTLYKYFGTREEWLQLIRKNLGCTADADETKEETGQIIKEYPIKEGKPLDICFDTEDFTFSVSFPINRKIVKIIFSKK